MSTKSKKTPLVSVVTATFNDERYIETSIRSVLNQDFTDFEYIIINDGSSDDTRKIIESLQKNDSRIKLINQKNQGLVASLNKGLIEASGKYIARIDGDDEWLPHKLKTQVEMLESDDNLVLVGGGAELINEQSVPTGFVVHVSRNDDIRTGMCLFNQFNHSSVVYRRELAISSGLYPNSCPAEDYELFSKFIKIGKVANLPYPVFRYRISSGSISGQHRDEQNELSKKISVANWRDISPKVISRSNIKLGFSFYLDNPQSPDFGVSLKHAYILTLTRSGYRMLNNQQIVDGLHQLLNIASTGRTGLKIVWSWGMDIIKIKLRGTNNG